MFIRIAACIITLLVVFACQSSGNNTNQLDNQKSTSHHLDFKNNDIAEHPQLVERRILDFLEVLNQQSAQASKATLGAFMDELLAGDTAVISLIVDEVLEKYLYQAGSPIRNERYYLTVVDRIISNNRIDAAEKGRFAFQQRMMRLNQPGQFAENFAYVTDSGERGTLKDIGTEHLLIYFNNPDCAECKRVKRIMEQSAVINDGIKSKRLKVLSVYTDGNLSVWEGAQYLPEWINTCDGERQIADNHLYDLRAIPSLYLLDKDKRVIIKDGLIEEILDLLTIKLKAI